VRTVRKARVEEIRDRHRRKPSIDPTAPARLRGEQEIGAAIATAAVVALVGAWVWAALTALTGWAFGAVAVALGMSCGYAVQLTGKGIDGRFGAIAAAAALLSTLAGELLLGEVDLYTLAFCIVAAGSAYPLARRRLTEDEETALWRERMGFLDRPPGGSSD